MAYDPNDAADKKILADAVAAALAEASEEHEIEISGLKDKNKELLGKLKQAQKGEADPAELARLEGELERLSTDLKAATKRADKAEKDAKAASEGLEQERQLSTKEFTNRALTEGLLAVNVSKPFLPAVSKLLAEQVTIKQEGEARLAMVGEKSLGDFLKDWSQGDDGKHYISAPNNNGGNANGQQGNPGSGKKLDRAGFESLGASEKIAFFKEGGNVTDTL